MNYMMIYAPDDGSGIYVVDIDGGPANKTQWLNDALALIPDFDVAKHVRRIIEQRSGIQFALYGFDDDEAVEQWADDLEDNLRALTTYGPTVEGLEL